MGACILDGAETIAGLEAICWLIEQRALLLEKASILAAERYLPLLSASCRRLPIRVLLRNAGVRKCSHGIADCLGCQYGRRREVGATVQNERKSLQGQSWSHGIIEVTMGS